MIASRRTLSRRRARMGYLAESVGDPIVQAAISGQITPQQAINEIMAAGGSTQNIEDYVNYEVNQVASGAEISRARVSVALAFAQADNDILKEQALSAFLDRPLSGADLDLANAITTQALIGQITPAAAIAALKANGLQLQEHNYVNYVMGIQGNPTPAQKLVAYAFANDINDFDSLYELAVMYQYNTGPAAYVGTDTSKGYSSAWANAIVAARQAAAVSTHNADSTWLDQNTPAIVRDEQIAGAVIIGLESSGLGAVGLVTSAITTGVTSTVPKLAAPTVATAVPNLSSIVAPPSSVAPAGLPAGHVPQYASSSSGTWLFLGILAALGFVAYESAYE
jgi:hypothetical protein